MQSRLFLDRMEVYFTRHWDKEKSWRHIPSWKPMPETIIRRWHFVRIFLVTFLFYLIALLGFPLCLVVIVLLVGMVSFLCGNFGVNLMEPLSIIYRSVIGSIGGDIVLGAFFMSVLNVCLAVYSWNRRAIRLQAAAVQATTSDDVVTVPRITEALSAGQAMEERQNIRPR